MKFTLNEHGICLADVAVEPFCKYAIENRIDIHTSNQLTLIVFRSLMSSIPVKDRPKVEWSIYGRRAEFNEYMTGITKTALDPRHDIALQHCANILRNSRKEYNANSKN